MRTRSGKRAYGLMIDRPSPIGFDPFVIIRSVVIQSVMNQGDSSSDQLDLRVSGLMITSRVIWTAPL